MPSRRGPTPAPFRSPVPSRAPAGLAILAALAGPSLAHHPGSHAVRQADGRVKVDAVVTASDTCTAIAAIEPGAPAGVRAAPGSEPVTLRLSRPPGAMCATAVTATRREAVLPIPAPATHLHLYVVAPDGRVQATERVPVR